MTPRHRAIAHLEGDERLGCVWFYDMISERRYAVLWPNDYRAGFNPLRLYNAKGEVVWREGEQRNLTGGPSEMRVERIPRECRVGKLAWWLPSEGVPFSESSPPSPRPL